MPTPQPGESEDQFIARCIPIVLDDGTAEDNEQAVAICYSMWREREGDQRDREMSKSSQAQEHKTLPFIVTKIDGDQGVVEHTIAVMGNVDLGNDRIHPGAFAKTIHERASRVRVLDAHNAGSVLNVIGKPLALWEIGRDDLPAKVRQAYPDAVGALMARTQFLMDTPEGKGAFTRIRDGAVDEYSIGYDALRADYTDETVSGKEITVRNLREIRLWEYSVVPFAMNPATSTLSAKERREPDPEPPRYVPEDEDKGASGSTTLPIADRARAWDATAAERRVRAWADAEDAPNAKYRSAFFWYDGGAADQFGSYKLQFADVIDGTLTAIPRAVFAAAAALQGSRGGVDIPDGDRAGVRSRVERYYARMRSQFDDEGIVVPWKEKDAAANEEAKVGRTFSAANIQRIQTAIDSVQAALADLEQMLAGAIPADDEPEGDTDEQANDAPGPDAQAAMGQDEDAGPPDEAPTSDVTVADIDDWIKAIQQQLSEDDNEP